LEDFAVLDKGPQNHVVIDNGLDEEVFIAAGATFEGTSQNRAAVYPGVIAAKSRVEGFPVHCIERGCGTGETRFKISTSILIASARSGTTPGVEDQTRTWTTISDTQRSLGTFARTEDYAEVDRQINVEDFIQFFRKPHRGQVGFLAAIRNNGTYSFYADMFGNSETFEHLSGRLYRSIAVVAKQRNPGDIEIDQSEFDAVLDLVRDATFDRVELDGKVLGETYTSSKPIEGTVLIYDNNPVQLSFRREHYSKERSRKEEPELVPA